MLYLQRKPAPPLDRFVHSLWYASDPAPAPGRQRILPTGNTQIILSLNRNHLLDCREGQPSQAAPGAQIVGARSTYEIIDNSDLACIIGLVFRPAGFSALMGAPADLFANRFIGLTCSQTASSALRTCGDPLPRACAIGFARLQCPRAALPASKRFYCIASPFGRGVPFKIRTPPSGSHSTVSGASPAPSP